MRRLTIQFFAIVALVSYSFLPATAAAAQPLRVVASFSILGDLVQQVGGERIKVTTLVGANADAHTFEPRPSDAKAILGAKLVVINGLGFEPWAEKLIKSAHYTGPTLVASQGIQTRQLATPKGGVPTDIDPHGWQDPSNVMRYVKNIAESLSSLDPEGAASYKTNSESYLRELSALDQFARDQIGRIAPAKRQVITSHDAFGYFAARYQIRFLSPQGVNGKAEPSAKTVALLIRQIRQDQIKAVFIENMSSPKLLAQITRDTGIVLGPKLYVDALSGPTEPGATYLDMMHYNITELVAGMKLN